MNDRDEPDAFEQWYMVAAAGITVIDASVVENDVTNLL